MGAQPGAEGLAQLMGEFRNGNKAATNRLISVFYPELRRIAAAQMKSERVQHTWQPTVLVNELYLELLKIKRLKPAPAGPGDEDRLEKEAFVGLAAHLMKRLLIRHARPLAARAVKVSADEYPASDNVNAGELQELENMLSRLAEIDPKLRRVVEMKVFEGFSIDEIATELGCAPRSVARYWSFARQWLQQQLGGNLNA